MPRPRKQARLWLRPARRDEHGRIVDPARFIIKDGSRQIGTGCGEGQREEAERRFASYLQQKYEPDRQQRDLTEVRLEDVINVFIHDRAHAHARPKKTAERLDRLLDFFTGRTLADINGALCREYVSWREGKGRTVKGGGGGAKRDLEDLRAAINHHHKEGLHREVVRVVLPKRGQARQRWLSRDEFARLLWICWRTRELQDGRPTLKRPLRHLCRFLILAIYTGSRPGVVMTAAWDRGPGRSWVDVDGARFYRQPEGGIANNKRQTPVKMAPRLAAHMRRWRAKDGGAGHVVTFGGLRVESVKTALNRACELAGLGEGVSAYTLRHTAATWLVAKGLPTRKVADFLGTSEGMIVKHYGHLAPDYQDEAALAIGKR